MRVRAAHLLERTIFCGLLALIPLAALPYGTVQPWWEAAFECAVFMLAALWVIESNLSAVWRISGGRMLTPLVAIIIFAIVQTLPLWGAAPAPGIQGEVGRTLSADPYETRRFVYKLIALVLAGELLLRYTSSRQRLRALIYTVIGVGVASALFGIVRQTVQHDSPGFVLPHLMPDVGYGQFINRNHFPFLMEMALGLTLGLIVGGGVKRERLLICLAAAVPVWAALVLSNSRGGILSMLSQLLFIALLLGTVCQRRELPEQTGGARGRLSRLGGSPFVRVLLVACLLMAVTLSTVWMGGDPLASRLESESVSSELNLQRANSRPKIRRIDMWRATWQLFKAHPVAGVGFGGYWLAVPEHFVYSGKRELQQAHNDYLEALASGGLIGGVLGAWFLIAFIRSARERLRSKDAFRRAACFGALAGLFGVAVHSLVDFGLHITINALILVALVVIATADERVEKRLLRRGDPARSWPGIT